MSDLYRVKILRTICHDHLSGKDIAIMDNDGPFIVPLDFVQSYVSKEEMDMLLECGGIISKKYVINKL